MKISEFKSGQKQQRYKYQSFEPNEVNINWEVDDPNLLLLLNEASFKLGELNAFSQLIPDVDFFIKMHVAKEGTTSSQIEGTQTNIDEVLQKIEYIETEKRDDWQEVQNYIQAMNEAIIALPNLPLSNRLLKQTHTILLQGVRGMQKLPVEFRSSQNWIGGTSLADAIFIPPYYENVPKLMSDLELFLHSDKYPVPPLIKIGIAHYQFETIHPFLDGNGRIGRLLITLFLVSNELLVKPTLYLSSFFEKNKLLYYDNLTKTRTQNDLTQWLKFFLEGVRATAEQSIQTFKNIIQLRIQIDNKILPMGKKQEDAKLFLQFLYKQPYIMHADEEEIALKMGKSVATIKRLIKEFVKLGILLETTKYKRNRKFVFEDYVKLFR